jgi:hypothetical protein
VAVGGSILIIIWHLLSDRTGRFHDLGLASYGHPAARLPDRRTHRHGLDLAPHSSAGCCRYWSSESRESSRSRSSGVLTGIPLERAVSEGALANPKAVHEVVALARGDARGAG